MRLKLGRRALLRGLAGTVVALPLLDAMLDDNGEALADTTPLPRRYLVSFGGFSLRTDQDGSTDGFIPNVVGPGYDLKAALAPLGDIPGHGSVQDRVNVVSNLSIPMDWQNGNPPPGGGKGFHHHMPCLFCGHTSYGDDFNLPDFPGSSSDQLVADAIGQGTTFPSLAYKVQASDYVLNQVNHTFRTMSWRKTTGPSASSVTPVVSPKVAYETLFTNFTPADPVEAQAKARELLRRKSVLDLVDRRMDGMLAELGAADKRRLDQHLTAVRELELLLDGTDPSVGNPACQLLPHPGDDPPIGSSQDFGFPNQYNVNGGWSDEESRAALLVDLLHMAFVCDLTRAASLMLTQVQSNMNCHPISGHSWVFHSLHHHGGTTSKLNDMIAWHVKHFGRLVGKLRDTPEGTGTLLDNCALAFMCEGGNGPVVGSDPNETSHSTDGMVMLVAGGAGGLRQGEHVVAPAGTHTANVLITLMNAVGAPTQQLGEISGELTELWS